MKNQTTCCRWNLQSPLLIIQYIIKKTQCPPQCVFVSLCFFCTGRGCLPLGLIQYLYILFRCLAHCLCLTFTIFIMFSVYTLSLKKKKKSFSQGMWLSLFVVLSTRFLFSSLNTIIWLCLIAIHLNTRTNYPPLSGNSAHPRMKTASRQGDHFFYIFARSRTSTCALFTPKLESLESDLLVQK